tara:strand:- start:1764 stop:2276 length:513 start_codon:yes stop_codon:yes gene_type:complete
MPYPGGNIIRVTPTLSTDAYAASDVLFNFIEIPNAVSNRGGTSMLKAMYVVDYSDTSSIDYKMFFAENNSSELGTINATANISDANFKALNPIGYVFLDAAQGTTSGIIDDLQMFPVLPASGAQEDGGPNILLKAAPGSTSVYVSGIIVDGTPTYAADSLQLIFHIKYLD